MPPTKMHMKALVNWWTNTINKNGHLQGGLERVSEKTQQKALRANITSNAPRVDGLVALAVRHKDIELNGERMLKDFCASTRVVQAAEDVSTHSGSD